MFFKKSNKKWQKRPQLYKGRFFYLKQISQIFVIILFCACIVGTVLYFKNSKSLFIKNIQVLGDHPHISAIDIIKLSEITNSNKLFAIRSDAIIQNIKKFPWIDSVSVRRKFPDTIQIYVSEKKTKALLRLDQFYLVDKDANIFKPMEKNDNKDLPIISGFDRKFILKFPKLSQKYLSEVIDFLLTIEKNPIFAKEKIAEVHFDPIFGFTVFTENTNLEIFYGRNNIETKQKKLIRFFSSHEFKKKHFVRIDLDGKNKIIARYDRS